jgi:Ca-activated chloride channel family protein
LGKIIQKEIFHEFLWNRQKSCILFMKSNEKIEIMKTKITILATLLMMLISGYSAETKTITGTVTDNNDNPVAGVSVTVRGTSIGTLTGTDGKYSITTNGKGSVLVFTFIGFQQHEEKIGDRSVINVKLTEEPVALYESVVTAYGISRKAERADKAAYAAAPSSGGYGYYNRPVYPNINTESYASVDENGFKSSRSNPLSTFSIDVDNASYANIRRFINDGQLPPADAVRIEEMINYFRYDYPGPESRDPFSVSAEMAFCPWNQKHYLLKVGLRGKDVDKSDLPPSNLVFLIDVSGSMSDPDKLPLLKSALRLLVNELREEDHVAIVVYAGSAEVVMESTPGSNKSRIINAIDGLQPGGSTAGGAGLKMAYREAEANFLEEGNNRIILATDGDFNVGESSNGAMEKLVEEKRRKGIFITVLGFGMGNIKDDKMEIIADKGNGNYSYIDNLQEARRVLVKEFGGTLFTIAKDVKFQLEFNPARVESYRLIGYENRLLEKEDFNDDKKDAGEMGSGHTVTALYELVPAGSDENPPAVDPLKYQKTPVIEKPVNVLANEYLTIKVRYKEPDGSTSRLLTKVVTGPVRKIGDASADLRFAASVAEFGMLLKNSEFAGECTFDTAAALARSAGGDDEEGYRSEFIRLIKTAKALQR